MKKLIISSLVFCIISCQSSVPKNVLPPAKMQEVMWDMMQADAMAEYYAVRDSALSELQRHVNYYQDVLTLHKISKEDFKTSLSYYQNHPSKLKVILDSLQSFTEKRQTIDTIKKQNHPPISDSLKKKIVSPA